MKKIINKLREKDIDVIVLIIFIMLLSPVLLKPIIVDDELWNFSFVYKMNLGYIPYKELNIIVTPLFHLIGIIIFNISEQANYFMFRIYAFLIEFVLLLLIFKILKNLKVSKINSIMYVILIYLLIWTIIGAGANYNTLALIPVLFFILLMIKKYDNFYIYGILVFITFLIKQSIGVYFGIGMLLYILINKEYGVKNIIKIFLPNVILMIIFGFLLYRFNIFYNFVDIAILGIKEFGIKNIRLDESILYIVLDIILLLFIIVIIKNKKRYISDEVIKNSKNILCIGIPLILIGYPIFNYSHIIWGSVIIIINSFYLIDYILIKNILNGKMIKKIIFILIIVIFLKGTIYLYNVINNFYFIKDNKSPYYGGMIDHETENRINNMNKFIDQNKAKNIKIIILSDQANVYFVPRNENNNIFDLPFLGNLGKNGENELIKQIKCLNNTKILITTDDDDGCYQESRNVRRYIQENYEKSETIENFDVYYIDN